MVESKDNAKKTKDEKLEKDKPKGSLFGVFYHFADSFDVFLMIVGSLCSTAAGVCHTHTSQQH